MVGLSSLVTASLLALRLFSQEAAAAPAQEAAVDMHAKAQVQTNAVSSWWVPNVQRRGAIPFGGNNKYQVYRNVKDFGAKGDGVTDDTNAINQAISSGGRCGQGCDSSTTSPAIVYIPPGTYLVSSPIVLWYYTHLIGDVTSLPILKATPGFSGIAVLDSDPYMAGGANWYTNQNNFFRHVRNLVIDITAQPMSTGTGMHWQVAQSTSLQNIQFQMNPDKSTNNKQQGIFMDNGSGGWMTDLTFNGGAIGAFFGNQQFTTRNLVFNGCQTAIYMNWNWVWSLAGITVNNANIGIDMTAGGSVQGVGSVVVLDSKFSNTQVGVLTRYQPNQGWTNSTLVLDNVDMSSTAIAVKGANADYSLQGGSVIRSYVQGRSYTPSGGSAIQAPQTASSRPSALVDSTGKYVTKSKPQYTDVSASAFVSVKANGAKGDGVTDDSDAIQRIFNNYQSGQIIYFDYGAYIISKTITIPSTVKVVGEMWPLIVAGGGKTSSFQDQSNPKPVWQVGKPGDVGDVEISDLIFETQGPQPGAILLQMHVKGSTRGSVGLFDVHFRIGGSNGSQLQSNICAKTPNTATTPNPECFGAFILLHLAPTSSVYVENCWAWVADHELDLSDHNQINIYNGRGIVVQSTQGTWMWGTAAEHSVLVNYNIVGANNVFASLIQTETAYFQGNPDARVPFAANSVWGDPTFSNCGSSSNCARTWGLRVVNSTGVHIYGAGLYSFFDNYNQPCVDANNCQLNMVDIQDSNAVELYSLTTKASINMITLNNAPIALDKDNRNNFCASVAAFRTSS